MHHIVQYNTYEWKFSLSQVLFYWVKQFTVQNLYAATGTSHIVLALSSFIGNVIYTRTDRQAAHKPKCNNLVPPSEEEGEVGCGWRSGGTFPLHLFGQSSVPDLCIFIYMNIQYTVCTAEESCYIQSLDFRHIEWFSKFSKLFALWFSFVHYFTTLL